MRNVHTYGSPKLINDTTSKLLIKTFDGSLVNLKLRPECMNSTVEFDIRYYDYDRDGSSAKAKVIFCEVATIDLINILQGLTKPCETAHNAAFPDRKPP